MSRRGFTLLEVMLATVILLGSAVVLGELARLGLRSGHQAETMGRATMLCQSLLAEAAIGSLSSEPATDVPAPHEPGWLYSLEREAAPHPDLALVRLTVRQDLPPEKKPAQCTLERWIRRPAEATLEGSPTPANAAPAGAQRDYRGLMQREQP